MNSPCRLAALMCLVLVTSASLAHADDRRGTMSVSEGTRFVVAFPQVWADELEEPTANPMVLYISSQVANRVRVRTIAKSNDLGASIDKTYTVKARNAITVPISRSLMMPSADTNDANVSAVIRGFGIEITSVSPISVATYQSWNGNGELTHHLPVAAWGNSILQCASTTMRMGRRR